MNLQLVYRYILSLSKNENMFYEKNNNNNNNNRTKKKKRKFPMAKVEPRSINVQRKRVI